MSKKKSIIKTGGSRMSTSSRVAARLRASKMEFKPYNQPCRKGSGVNLW